ncbi:MAG: cation:proton antiporter [Deltaproteobacteria bacterium]|nr:cation:proton antiporter [Deltaproteobacteria bacterium]
MTSILTDIIIIFGLLLAVVYVCHRLRLPTVVGFLLTGVLVGPHGLGFIRNVHEVEVLAEVGVVLLLFSIGLEFSFRDLRRLKRTALIGGSLQVFLLVGAGGGLALLFGLAWSTAVFCGFLVALSSTAIVLKLMQERAVLESPAGNASLAILLFQDIIVVPMIFLTPLLAGGQFLAGGEGWWFLVKGLAAMAILFAGARWLVPAGLNLLAATRSREVFIIAVVSICLGAALLTWWAGLSIALGAFIAGLILADSPYGHQAVGSIMPLRDLFTSLFFVSIGMLFDFSFVLREPGLVLAVAGAVIVLKALISAIAAKAVGLPLGTALAVALGLSQVGEFSFILARVGLEHDLLQGELYQLLLVVTVITMALSPALMTLGQALGRRKRLPAQQEVAESKPADHVVVVGFGLNGRNVAHAARLAGISYMIVEMNPTVVREEQAKGENIFYGDASMSEVLLQAGLAKARVLVIAIADPVATRHITATAKALNPSVHVIARTRFVQEVEELHALGADEVIPEEYETSVEIFTRVLRRLMVPETEIRRRVAELKARDYQRLRIQEPTPSEADSLAGLLADVHIATLLVQPGASLAGQSLGEANLRRRHGVTVLAIRRGDALQPAPGAEAEIAIEDQLIVLGSPEAIADVSDLFQGEDEKG